MSRKNKRQEEMEFEYELPADFDEEPEQVIYVDENGNPVDEQGNPVSYVDENGNPIVIELPKDDSEPAVIEVVQDNNTEEVLEEPVVEEEEVIIEEAPVEEVVEEEVILDASEELEEIIYVDEDGNPVDENGNPIVYVDENGNPIDPLDASSNQEVVMEVIDEDNDEYKEDTIFEPYGDEEEAVEEVVEVQPEPVPTPTPTPMPQPTPVVQPNPSNFQPQPNVQMYGSNNQHGYNPVAFQPTNETIVRQIRPGLEEVTYVEYERILPDEVMNEKRILDNSRVTPVNFIERVHGQDRGVRPERGYVEYELEHPYGRISCNPVSKVEDSQWRKEELFGNKQVFRSDFSQNGEENTPFSQARKEFNDGMRDIYNNRKQREQSSAKQREQIYLQSRQNSSPRPTCNCGCQYCCHQSTITNKPEDSNKK